MPTNDHKGWLEGLSVGEGDEVYTNKNMAGQICTFVYVYVYVFMNMLLVLNTTAIKGGL